MRADVLVVGAGSAGCVLAGRLAAAGRHVVLVEAGPDGATPAVDSVDFFAALEDSARTWPDLLVRRTTTQAPTVYRRGRGLGGSSAVNALVALPGLRADYADWPEGWGGDVLAARFADARAGRTPLRLVDAAPTDLVPFERAIVAALEGRGVGRVDPWTSDDDGWFPATWTATAGADGALRRWSAGDAYLPTIGRPPRLTVVSDAPVTRVVLDGRSATGVVLSDGRRIDADEVIVAAGAIHSPLLLAASGVERPDLGRRLKDHAAVACFVELAGAPSGADAPLRRPAAALLARVSSGLVPGDLQLLVLHPAGPWPAMAGTAIVMISLMQVDSTGVVAAHGIEQRMLSEERDRVRLRTGVRLLADLLADAGVVATVTGSYCDDVGTPASWLATPGDDELDAWMLAHLGDYVHVAGSCRMGPAGDPAAVVDPACRVVGYEGLRVCDASVLPDLPRANTHLTTWAMAEELAARSTSGSS